MAARVVGAFGFAAGRVPGPPAAGLLGPDTVPGAEAGPAEALRVSRYATDAARNTITTARSRRRQLLTVVSPNLRMPPLYKHQRRRQRHPVRARRRRHVDDEDDLRGRHDARGGTEPPDIQLAEYVSEHPAITELTKKEIGSAKRLTDLPRLFTRHGGLGKKDLAAVRGQLAAIPERESRVVLATGRYIGQGFDDARLDTLFLTLPISWRGTIAQYRRDRRKDTLLQESDCFVLRFLAEDVGKRLDDVLDAILRAMANRRGGSQPGPRRGPGRRPG